MILNLLFLIIQILKNICINILELVYKASLLQSQWKLTIKSFIFILLPLIVLVIIFNNFQEFISTLDITTKIYIVNLVSLYSCYILSLIIIRIFYLIKNFLNLYFLFYKDRKILFIYLTYLGITLFFTSLSVLALTRIYFSFYILAPDLIQININFIVIFSSLFSLFYIGFNIDSNFEYWNILNKQTNIIIAIITLLMITYPAWFGYFVSLFVNNSMNKYFNLDLYKDKNSNYFITLLNRVKFNIWKNISVECASPEDEDLGYETHLHGNKKDKGKGNVSFNFSTSTFRESNVSVIGSNNDTSKPSVTQTSTPSSPRIHPQNNYLDSHQSTSRLPTHESTRNTTNNEINKPNSDNTTVNFNNSTHYHYHNNPYSEQPPKYSAVPSKYSSLEQFNPLYSKNNSSNAKLNTNRVENFKLEPEVITVNPKTFFDRNMDVLFPENLNTQNTVEYLSSIANKNLILGKRRRIEEPIEVITKRVRESKFKLDRDYSNLNKTYLPLASNITVPNNNFEILPETLPETLPESLPLMPNQPNSAIKPLIKVRTSSDLLNLIENHRSNYKIIINKFKDSLKDGLPFISSFIYLSGSDNSLTLLEPNSNYPINNLDPDFKNTLQGKFIYDCLINMVEKERLSLTYLLYNLSITESYWTNIGTYLELKSLKIISEDNYIKLVEYISKKALEQNGNLNNSIIHQFLVQKKLFNIIVFLNGFYSYLNREFTEIIFEGSYDDEFKAFLNKEILLRNKLTIPKIFNPFWNLVKNYNFLFETQDFNTLDRLKIVLYNLFKDKIIINEDNISEIITPLLVIFKINQYNMTPIDYKVLKSFLLTSNLLEDNKTLMKILGLIKNKNPSTDNHRIRIDYLAKIFDYFNTNSIQFIRYLPSSMEENIEILENNFYLKKILNYSLENLKTLFDFTNISKHFDIITLIKNNLNYHNSLISGEKITKDLTKFYEDHKKISVNNDLLLINFNYTISGYSRVLKNSFLLGTLRYFDFKDTINQGILNPNITFHDLLNQTKGSFFKYVNSEGISVYILTIIEEKDIYGNTFISNKSVNNTLTNITPQEFWCDSKEKLEALNTKLQFLYFCKVEQFINKHYTGNLDKEFFKIFNRNINLSSFKSWIILNSENRDKSFNEEGLNLVHEGTKLAFMNNALKKDIPTYYRK